jgi:hypothetical protein
MYNLTYLTSYAQVENEYWIQIIYWIIIFFSKRVSVIDMNYCLFVPVTNESLVVIISNLFLFRNYACWKQLNRKMGNKWTSIISPFLCNLWTVSLLSFPHTTWSHSFLCIFQVVIVSRKLWYNIWNLCLICEFFYRADVKILTKY